MYKALCYGILSAFFFSLTFILNRSMHLDGGYWLWSAILRYAYMIPILLILLLKQGKLPQAMQEIQNRPSFWVLWSTVGFGLFYAPLTFASAYGESWLIAATWQITIVAGVLLTPFFGQKIPRRTLAISCMIVLGVFVMQIKNMHFDKSTFFLTVIPIVIAAFAYPLGNRKTMQHSGKHIDAMQRVFIMSVCSLPFWLICAAYALFQDKLPSAEQHFFSFLVALSSGVIATYLFFAATDMIKNNTKQLAIIEATQSGEVIFTFIGGIILLNDTTPTQTDLYGMSLILLGMILHSVTAKHTTD